MRGRGQQWRNGSILIVGVVGGIGGGKSTVAELLSQPDGLLLNADHIGHALLDQRPTRQALEARFGPAVIHPAVEPGEEPTVERSVLASIVFADENARRDLETILHPRMRQTFEKGIARAVRKNQCRMAILDAAILFEAGWNELCDRVVFVDAPPEQRLARVQATRGWNAENLSRREQAQWPLGQKKSHADYVVRNDGGLDDLRQEVAQLRQTLMALKPSQKQADPTQAANEGANLSDPVAGLDC